MSSSDETVRKIYVKDLRVNSDVYTVFRVIELAKHTSRAGKPYLAAVLADKTGTIEARAFEQVEELAGKCSVGDYVLVRGTVGAFHRHSQVMLQSIERLDPTPIDPKEFTPPPAPTPAPKREETRGSGPKRGAATSKPPSLLTDPGFQAALTTVLKHLERYIEECVDARLAQRNGSASRQPAATEATPTALEAVPPS